MPGLFDDASPLIPLAGQAPAQIKLARPVTRGSLIVFNYPRSMAAEPNVIHDPRPMVLVTDVWPQYIRGVNMNYFTVPSAREVLMVFSGNPAFQYNMFRNNAYMTGAFRIYVRRGMAVVQRLDTEFLKEVVQSVRRLDVGELERIRQIVKQQIDARLQARAQQLTALERWQADQLRQQRQQFRQAAGIPASRPAEPAIPAAAPKAAPGPAEGV